MCVQYKSIFKKRLSINLMQKYVKLNGETIQDKLFSIHIIFITVNTIYGFFFLTFFFLFFEKNNHLQYSFLTIGSFRFIFISETVVYTITSEEQHNIDITVKNSLTSDCNTILDTTKKVFQLN